MIQAQRDRSQTGSIGLTLALSALLFSATVCLSGCGDDQGSGMIDNPKDVTKTPDAQDSMKGYMQQMKNKGMKPGMKTVEAPKK